MRTDQEIMEELEPRFKEYIEKLVSNTDHKVTPYSELYMNGGPELAKKYDRLLFLMFVKGYILAREDLLKGKL